MLPANEGTKPARAVREENGVAPVEWFGERPCGNGITPGSALGNVHSAVGGGGVAV